MLQLDVAVCIYLLTVPSHPVAVGKVEDRFVTKEGFLQLLQRREPWVFKNFEKSTRIDV